LPKEMKILMLDEDAGSRARLAIRLETLGFIVLQAGTFPEAKMLLYEQMPDLLLMEWGTASKTGRDLILDLAWPPSKTIVFTDQPLESIVGDLNACGLTSVYRKTDRMELLEALEKLFEGRENSSATKSIVDALPKTFEILVIDDSSTIRKMIRVSLEERFKGCSVREADDGRTALAEMGRKKVDLLITDLEMPGMDGRDFLARIDSNPLLSKKSIIVYSGNITKDLQEAYGTRSNFKLLTKPCDVVQVMEAAEKLLALRKMH
jgi:CheY-like chemotaxis protein